MNAKQKAIKLIEIFGIKSELVANEVIRSLPQIGITPEAHFWADVKKEIRKFNDN